MEEKGKYLTEKKFRFSEKGLSEIDLKIIDQWMKTKFDAPKCPMCGESAFFSGETSVIPSMLINKQVVNWIPVVSIICRNCGYVLLFSAEYIGLEDLEY
jgi:predicted nucleic-acid-binding Zn-ribbon protein